MAWVNIKSLKKCVKLKKKNQKIAKNRGSFLPSPVPPLNKGTGEGPKITEHPTERSAEQGMFGLSLFCKIFVLKQNGSCCKSEQVLYFY